MKKAETRNPRSDELPALQSLWENTFGNIGKEAFFNHYYNPEMCVVAEWNHVPASAGYLIPYGEIQSDNESLPCAMIYSVATLPECRGIGFGSAVVNGLIRLAYELGYSVIVLCPSEDGLFEYYKSHTQLCDWFYVEEQTINNIPVGTAASLPIPISAVEYSTLREELLRGITHIKHDLRALEYQQMLCQELGGGLCRIGNSCAVVERQPDGTVWVKEFLIPGGSINDLQSCPVASDAISAIMQIYPANNYIVRYPAGFGKGRRFGMLADCGNKGIKQNNSAPWYGVAFD